MESTIQSDKAAIITLFIQALGMYCVKIENPFRLTLQDGNIPIATVSFGKGPHQCHIITV